jgi:hypothetical protein
MSLIAQNPSAYHPFSGRKNRNDSRQTDHAFDSIITDRLGVMPAMSFFPGVLGFHLWRGGCC